MDKLPPSAYMTLSMSRKNENTREWLKGHVERIRRLIGQYSTCWCYSRCKGFDSSGEPQYPSDEPPKPVYVLSMRQAPSSTSAHDVLVKVQEIKSKSIEEVKPSRLKL